MPQLYGDYERGIADHRRGIELAEVRIRDTDVCGRQPPRRVHFIGALVVLERLLVVAPCTVQDRHVVQGPGVLGIVLEPEVVDAQGDIYSAEEIRQYRGTLTEPGKDSPYRNRSVEENLDLLERMKAQGF